MIFIENTCFVCNSANTNVCVTSGVVLLTDWMDLDIVLVVQLRETARVLGTQDAPADSETASASQSRASIK